MTEQDKKKQREIEEDARIEYHHTMPIQFRFTDADRFGHVNNSVYLQYYDTAKVDYFEKVGADIFHRDHAMVIAHIEFNFLGRGGADGYHAYWSPQYETLATTHRPQDGRGEV